MATSWRYSTSALLGPTRSLRSLTTGRSGTARPSRSGLPISSRRPCSRNSGSSTASVADPDLLGELKMTTPVVLITGALTGIGRATALAFAQEGASIVVSGRHEEEGQKLVGELGKLGAEAEFVRSDVRQEEDVRTLVDKTVARFGRLDVAVNNAGTEGKPGP